jgi:hypothetical protein
MPSANPLPTIGQLLDAFHTEAGTRLEHEDTHRGSIYDHAAGMGAMLFLRQAQRDRDEARALYFDTAEGDRLDAYIERRFDRPRVQDTFGVGVARIARPTAGAGAGTIWAGTRIAVGRGGADPIRILTVRTDRAVGASELAVNDLQVEATIVGPNGAVSGTLPIMRFEDPLWDNSWTFVELDVQSGTLREKDPEYRANTKDEQFDRRPGYPAFIEATMRGAGADTVVLFASNYLGDAVDQGINRIYVGDPAFETTPALLESCRLALPSCVMAGTGVQVLPMTQQALTVAVTIRLWDSPDKFDRGQEERDARDAVVGYFASRENPFVWKLAAIRAALLKAVRNVHQVDLVTSQPEPSLASIFASVPLLRYRVESWQVTVQILGPE